MQVETHCYASSTAHVNQTTLKVTPPTRKPHIRQLLANTYKPELSPAGGGSRGWICLSRYHLETLPAEIREELSLDFMGIHDHLDRIEEKLVDFPALFNLAFKEKQTETEKEFERDYLKHVINRYDKLIALGVRDLKDFKQKLSIAYVSLNIKTGEGEKSRQRPAKEVLLSTPLLALKGPAGSGKTTLSSWIALACASLEGDENPWRGGVPFVISLRHLTKEDDGKPNVANFTKYTIPSDIWPTEPPAGWIVKVLEEGRGVIIFDGVDELPHKYRGHFWEWLKSLVPQYPKNRILVTSRFLPKATHGEWDPPSGFVNAELSEMSRDDIKHFIHNWHDAAINSTPEQEVLMELKKARAELPIKLADSANRRVLELCSIPLLCSMVCALHWREDGYLPVRRIELYERCVGMLIEERDHKRGIEKPEPPLCWITRNDKEMLLQRLAFNMMKNNVLGDEDRYRVEISREQAVDWMKPWVLALKDVRSRRSEANEVLDYLIERTGLIREPAPLRIDFPHRSFQEYFAACAAGADGNAGLLANLAHDDQWRETIILAAGTRKGGVAFGKNLIEALLKRGERSRLLLGENKTVRQTCLALAVACLESIEEIDEDLRGRVLKHLDALIPPRDKQAASALAAAGETILKHLDYKRWENEPQTTVAACARVVRLVGGTEAIRMLVEDYGRDERELVLCEISLEPSINPLNLQGVQNILRQTSRLPYRIREVLTDLSPLSGLSDLHYLDLSGCSGVTDLSPLSGLSSLYFLDLGGCSGVTSLSPLSGLSGLKELHLTDCSGVTDLSPISGLTNLVMLILFYLQDSLDYAPLLSLETLRHIYITEKQRKYLPKELQSRVAVKKRYIPGITAKLSGIIDIFR